MNIMKATIEYFFLIGKVHTDTPKRYWSHDLTLHIIIERGSSI